MSATVRQQKYSKLILKELSIIFQLNKKGFLSGDLISISEVKMSPDLRVATIYVSMMLVKDKQAILDNIYNHKGEIRKALGDRIRNQVRIVPELVFHIDEVEESALRMDSLIKGLHIPPADTEN